MRNRTLTCALLAVVMAVGLMAPVPAHAGTATAHARHATRLAGWSPYRVQSALGTTIERRVHVGGPAHRWVFLQKAVGGHAVRQAVAHTDAQGFITVHLTVDQARSYYRLHVPRTRAYAAANSRWLRLTVPSSTPTGQATPTPTPTPTPVPAAVPGVIDVADRAAVIDAYTNQYKPLTWQFPEWSGDLASCNAGAPSRNYVESSIRAVNYFRAMAGVPPVTLNDSFSALAQQAALTIDVNHQLSHYPPTSWRCYSAAAAEGAQKSNLWAWWGRTPPSAGEVIARYVDDWGVDSVGHRLWVIRPQVAAMGVGTTLNANALMVAGDINRSIRGPSYQPWPTAGYFPDALVPKQSWSLSATNGTALDGASVTMSGPTGDLPVSNVRIGAPMLGSTLVWDVRVPPVTTDTAYTVHVTGPIDYSYTVTIVPVG